MFDSVPVEEGELDEEEVKEEKEKEKYGEYVDEEGKAKKNIYEL